MASSHPLARRAVPDALPDGLPLLLADIDRSLQVLAKRENATARRMAVLLAAGRTAAEAGQELGLSRPELQEARRRLRWAAERARAH
jgi:hypothetical protein